MEKGNGTGKHRDTGRQRSEPEEGKHARQPEGPPEIWRNRPKGSQSSCAASGWRQSVNGAHCPYTSRELCYACT